MAQDAEVISGDHHGVTAGRGSAITALSLVKRYTGAGRPALDDFDLQVAEGEFYGLLGPNGAGKTTAISILTGLIVPDHGTVRIMGMAAEKNPGRIKGIVGLAPQHIGLYDKLTALENLSFFGKLHGLGGNSLHQRIRECLDFANLGEYGRRVVSTFSFGMKRRLNLAVALLNHPRLLVLDEPCVGVDAQSRHLIHSRLHDLNQKGTTILYTTHYMEEAQELCDRVGIIDNGRLMEEGAPAHLLARSGLVNLEEHFLRLTGKGLRDI